MTDTKKIATSENVVEQIPRVVFINGERKTENYPGVRVSKHFAFCAGPRAFVHLPSGQTMPMVTCWQTDAARKLAERFEACSFVDWSQQDPTQQELSEEQNNILRAIATGHPIPEVANG